MPRSYAAAAAADGEHEVVTLKRPLEVLTLAEFLKRDFPPREMMLAPWLPAKGLALLFAPRGVGKTHFGLGVAYAVATGGSFLKWSAPKPRRVLLLDGEMPAATLQERLADIMQHSTIDPPDEGYVRLLASDLCELGMPDLATREGQAEIAPLISDAELIVVDNLSTICRSGKENESESWAIVQAWALQQRRAGRSVLFIHHAGKGGEQRGTSKREDVMDSVVKLCRPDDYEASEGARFIVAFTKSRGFAGSDANPFEAMLRDGLWSTKDLQDAQAEQAYQLSQDGLTQRQIAVEMNVSLAKANRLIARYKEALECHSEI
jgi:putative DNA primase/helicase